MDMGFDMEGHELLVTAWSSKTCVTRIHEHMYADTVDRQLKVFTRD